MSVAKQHHDAIPIRPLGDRPALKPKIVPREPSPTTARNEKEFWTEFNSTFDDFFTTIKASRSHIQRLTDQLAQRDQKIEALEERIAAMQEEFELFQKNDAASPSVSKSGEPVDASTGRPNGREKATQNPKSIWSRLTHLERGNGSQAPRE